MVFNKDEMEAPAWMDLSFFEKVIKHSESDENAEVHEFKVTPGTNVGDHFASIMFRVNIHFSSENNPKAEISVIIKTVPFEEGFKKDFLTNTSIFATEIKMYTTILPEMHRLLRSVNDDTELGAKLIYHEIEPAPMMIFEDLTKRGYGMNGALLEFEESKLVFKKLSRWHAASLYMLDDMPDIKSINKGAFNTGCDQFTDFWIKNMGTLAEIIAGWPGYEIYSEKFLKIQKSIFDVAADIYDGKNNDLIHVLNHGDFHFKNMLFKKNSEGVIIDPMLVDFQISVWGSPAIDLLYSLYMAVSADAREYHRDEIIKFYHDEFTATLKKFGYTKKCPTLHELQIEVLKCGRIEIILAGVFLPFMIFDISKWTEEELKMDLLSIEGMEEMNRKTYQNPAFVNVMKKCLPIFLNKGFFD